MLLAIYAIFLGEFVDDESLPDFWDSGPAGSAGG